MKHLPLIFALFLAGCGAIEIYSPDGKLVAREVSLLKNVGFQKFTAGAGGTSIQGGSAGVDDEAIDKIVEGVVAGLVKGVK